MKCSPIPCITAQTVTSNPVTSHISRNQLTSRLVNYFHCCSWLPEPIHSSFRSTWQPRSRSAACASSRHDWWDAIARRKCDSTPRLVNASTRSWRLDTMLRTAMHADFCNMKHTVDIEDLSAEHSHRKQQHVQHSCWDSERNVPKCSSVL